MIVRFAVLFFLVLMVFAPVGFAAMATGAASPSDVITEEISSGPTLPYTVDGSVKEMPKPEALPVPAQPTPPEAAPVDDKGWTEAQAPAEQTPATQPQQDDKKQQPPQMPQMPNQQKDAPMKPKDPMGKEFQCGDPPPPTDKCKPGCGYDNCKFKFQQEKGTTNCPKATQLKNECVQKMAECAAADPLTKAAKCAAAQQKCAEYQQKRMQCCKAHTLSELAQIKTQMDPCSSTADLATGGFLPAPLMEICKANSLNRCPVVDKKQLDLLKQKEDYIKSLGDNPNDLKSATDLFKEGGKYGQMMDALKKKAMMQMVQQVAGQAIQAAFQGGGSGSDSKGFQTSSGGSNYQVDNNEFATADLKTGDSLTLSQKDGSAQLQRSGDQVAVMARESAPSAVPVSYSSTNGVLMASSSATGVFSGAANEGILNSPQYYMDVYPKIPASSLSPLVPDSITGGAIVSNVLYYAIVRFFPGEPRMASMGEIHAGQVAQDWVAVIPRANARIDFHAASGFITNKVMGMGIPRGSSLMVSSKNLEAESILHYLIDGIKDYDFIIANGLTIWPYSGTPGGKIISSSFGIPPDQYLSKQQKGMVYG